MPPKVDRTSRRKETVPGGLSQGDRSQVEGFNSEAVPDEKDLRKLSASELLKALLKRNTDPIVGKMLNVLSEKISNEISEQVEAEKRARSLVVSGIDEAPHQLKPSERQKDLENKVADLLDVLEVECRPVEIYRMGKLDPSRPRLVKILLPSKAHWRTALANAKNLRSAGLANVFVRKSMTAEERRHEYELRQEARERNRGKSQREWVVFRGELRKISDLSQSQKLGNH
ncbi:hypothetical protein V3C99_001610, partial [Haemonchus contortus]